MMKAVTVISASAPRRVSAAQTDQDAGGRRAAPRRLQRRVGRRRRGRGGRGGRRPAPAGRRAARGPGGPYAAHPLRVHPSDLVPQQLTSAPSLTGTRTADGVVFRWQTRDGSERGDTWVWQRLDSGEVRRTDRDRVLIRTPEEVCVEVRLVRGTDESPASNECVPAG